MHRAIKLLSSIALAFIAPCAGASPFTWDTVNSNFIAGGLGPGGGSSGSNLPYFVNWPIGGGSNGAACGGAITFNDSGVLFKVGTMYTQWYQNNGSSHAYVRGRLIFTPTVPNLSYSFTGFMNIIETGVSTHSCTSAVELHPNYPHPPSLYTNNLYATGPAYFWSPSTPQLGAQTGDLLQGQEYVMNWDFNIYMTGGTDETARYEVKIKNDPNFYFRLYQRPCAGDLTGDGYVDDSDFVIFAASYDIFDCADPLMPAGCPADVNGDGYVDDADFVIFAQMYSELLCP